MSIPDPIRQRIRAAAQNRCGYCLSPQPLVFGWLEVEHLLPGGKGGGDAEENLWLACRLCNGYKAAQTRTVDPVSGESVDLYNPRNQVWTTHFKWSDAGTHILGLTPTGRATVIALQLNNSIALMVRREWVSAGWRPPGS